MGGAKGNEEHSSAHDPLAGGTIANETLATGGLGGTTLGGGHAGASGFLSHGIVILY
jgi:hypothetical protein